MRLRVTALLPLLLAATLMAQSKPAGNTYVFLVACSGYDNPRQFGTLPYTVKETAEFRQVLIDSGVKPERIKFLSDRQIGQDDNRFAPRKGNILNELAVLVNKLDPEDTLIVALNGHGVQPQGSKTAYFCPLNADLDEPKSLIALEGEGGLYEILKRASPKRKLLLVNACRDDPKAKATQAANRVNFDKGYKYEAPEGMAAIFSCQPGQFTYYYPNADKAKAKRERSLFFHHLIEAWQGRYAPKGRPVTLEDVFAEVRRRTADEADELFGDAQNPVIRREYSREWVVREAGLGAGGPPFDPTGGYQFAHFDKDGGTRALVVVNDAKAKTYDARVVDAESGKTLAGPFRHDGTINHAVFSPDGTRVATASADGTAVVWDAATGARLVGPLRHGQEVIRVQFSPDGSRLTTGSGDKTAVVWDSATGKSIGSPLRHESTVWLAGYSPDGSRLVTPSDDKTAVVWDAATHRPVGLPLRHDGRIYHADFSPDGTRVVTASGDKTARVWDAATGKPVSEPLQHNGTVWFAVFSPDGTRVVTGSADGTARVWDAATGKPVTRPLKHAQGDVGHATFSPDGSRVVSAGFDNAARVWDAATGEPVGRPLAHDGWVRHARFSPDGTRVVTSTWDGSARLWDSATGKRLGPASPE